VTAMSDAAVLYFALHGTDAELVCSHVDEATDERCDKPLAGVCHDDGYPLCEQHLREEGGHALDFDTIGELWLVRRTLESLGHTPKSTTRKSIVARSNLETFALRVAGLDPHVGGEICPHSDSGVCRECRDAGYRDTEPAPPLTLVKSPHAKHAYEAKIRGHRR
jgi:hypothetical protein